MKNLSRVVWREGMHLGPHHFQAQSQYFESILHFATDSLWYAPYGYAGIEFERETLRNGNVALVHARGVFPDGLSFHMPESDPVPEPRPIGDAFPPTRESLTVLLGIPNYRPSGANTALTAADRLDNMRYVAEPQSVFDENSGRDQKTVLVGRKSIRFYFENEKIENTLSMPVARIVRDGTGHYIYDPAFIPPLVQFGASERLMKMTRRLIDIMDEKSNTLFRNQRGAERFRAGFSSQEVAAFWFIHTVNSSLAALRHLYYTRRGHPEQLFLEMSRLGGALCTFGLDSEVQSLPQYDHLKLDVCFEELDRHVRKHLELVVPTNCIPIPLKQTGRYSFEGDITDQRVLDRARWIFAVRSDVGEVELISRTPRLVKICSGRLLPDLVKTALPGMTLTHLQVPPSAVAPKVDYQYFGVNRSGKCWEHIVETRKVGVHVPGELPNAEIELLVIIDT
jgi:type VI secretion system protein ImpJ